MYAARRTGFTLLEVMVALAIVGLVLVGALGAAGADLRASAKAASTIEAVALADALLERLEVRSAADLRALRRGRRGRFEPPLDRYRWRITSGAVPGRPSLEQVTVTVRWSDGAVRATTRIAHTVVAAAGSETR